MRLWPSLQIAKNNQVLIDRVTKPIMYKYLYNIHTQHYINLIELPLVQFLGVDVSWSSKSGLGDSEVPDALSMFCLKPRDGFFLDLPKFLILNP